MCPACIATAALIVTKASSAGALSALVVKKLRAKTNPKQSQPKQVPSDRRPL
jgi:hypothetical protein